MVDSGAAENVMPKNMFPKYPQRKRTDPRMGRGSKDHEESTSRTMASKSSPSELLEGFVHKSTWQVADVGRPLVSASHIIQAGSDLFIGKNEAHTMNRKKDKSMLRNEGKVYVLDLFVKVPSVATTSIKYKPMEIDAINQVADV